MLKWILLVEGEEAGQAAANVAWYFCKGSIGKNGICDYFYSAAYSSGAEDISE